MNFGDVLRIGAAGAISLGGGAAIAIAVIKFFSGVFAEQIAEATRHKHASDLEHLRAQYTTALEELRGRAAAETTRLSGRINTAVYRSKVQFDLEFGILQRIWKELSATRRLFGTIRAGLPESLPDETITDGVRRRSKPFVAALNALKPAAHDNEPFYPREVFDAVQNFIALCSRELIDDEYAPEHLPDWWQNAQAYPKEAERLADEVAEAIRAHLRNVVIISD
jgi:hypothetical protein